MRSSLGLFYQITVKDRTGKVVHKTRLRRSKSFCLAFLQLLEVHFKDDTVVIKDIAAANKTIDTALLTFKVAAGIGVVLYGIVIGTGTTTPTSADYVMETLIAHGSAATQINYAANTFVAAQEVGANVDLQLIRSMQNLSGGTINVTEAGVQGIGYQGGSPFYFLMVHDVFTAVPVADGETITVTYTFRTTV